MEIPEMPPGSMKSRRRPRLFAAITNLVAVPAFVRIFTIAIFETNCSNFVFLERHGHANARGFESPIVSFEVYFIYNYVKIRLVVVAVAAQTWKASIFSQMVSRFDAVAWHGNRYVLTAKSNIPRHPLDFAVFICSRWNVTESTYRPPYFHRDSASEFVGLLSGAYEGRSESFRPGGASYETPHSETYYIYKMASEAALKPMQVLAWCVFCSESLSLFAWLLTCLTPRNPHAVVFILESSFILPFANYAARRCDVVHDMWDGVRVQFMDRLDEIKDEMQELRAMGT